MALSIQITNERINPLLNRKELHLIISHPNGNPVKSEVVDQLAYLYRTDKAHILVERCQTEKGMQQSTAWAKIYKDTGSLERTERLHVLVKKTGLKVKKTPRKVRKVNRKKKVKMFGSLKRNLKKEERKNK
ncbi:30S ribosomal protein S24e [Astathelohania contejeani]|uniref:30S ribosomal protein S24e n=1 Tax=Astathelohania contejeani TaxID=164912 RepID=A0ABQ7HZK6_9MICR|nr:30S ribosomal protein S24e [Thelohania contejeani]